MAAGLALASLWGCVSHQHDLYDSADQFAYTMPVTAGRNIFQYDEPTPEPEYYPIPSRRLEGYELTGLRFPSSGRNGQVDNLVSARYFKSLREPEQAKPLLIVLPIWATHTFPSTVMSNGYGMHSEGRANILWMNGHEPLFDWFSLRDQPTEAAFEAEVDESVERFRSVTIDIRRLIDWAETRPEIDASRIALVGFSMSAIVAANVAGTDPRVHSTVLVVGGAMPGDVMAQCEVIVGYMRDGVRESFGWSQEEFLQFFQRKLEFGDPQLWQGRYRSQNTLIVEASKDDCIPEHAREALWQATGRPERIVFPYNHWQPFLAMTPVGGQILSRDIFRFLDRKLFAQDRITPEPLPGMFCEVVDEMAGD